MKLHLFHNIFVFFLAQRDGIRARGGEEAESGCREHEEEAGRRHEGDAESSRYGQQDEGGQHEAAQEATGWNTLLCDQCGCSFRL